MASLYDGKQRLRLCEPLPPARTPWFPAGRYPDRVLSAFRSVLPSREWLQEWRSASTYAIHAAPRGSPGAGGKTDDDTADANAGSQNTSGGDQPG
jgi:hypothetical protein